MKKYITFFLALIFSQIISLTAIHPVFSLFADELSSEWEVIIDSQLQQDFVVEQKKQESNDTKDSDKNRKTEKVITNKKETSVTDIPKEKNDTKSEYTVCEIATEEEKISKNVFITSPTDLDEKQNNEISGETEKSIIQEEKCDTLDESKNIKSGNIINTEIELQKKIPLSIASEEILSRPDVEQFRQQFLTKRWTDLLYSYLENGMEYRLYVRQQIQKRNLPEVIEYLPVVESNYKPSAKSYSGAVGMWQFMENSVYPFLTLNDFVDQRLDPWYSTDAGLTKLQDNYNYFGDWIIAIAAYNCGGGTMSKAIRAAGVKDYWYLVDNGYLPKQTADYIPKLLAIADIAINSEYYGIDLPKHSEEFEILENEKNAFFDYITVNKAYSISELAQEIKVSTNTMKKLNASYIKGVTHPSKESRIRLPLGTEEAAKAAITKMTPIDYPFKYKVVAGDSLWSISRTYGVTVKQICDLNNIKENDILRIGKVLYIPSK